MIFDLTEKFPCDILIMDNTDSIIRTRKKDSEIWQSVHMIF